MNRFRVGLMDPVMAARPTADAFTRANYLAAVANRVDSYWVPDHINGQTPRPLWDKKYTVAARLMQSPDAAMEAWTLLGSLAARRRFSNVRLGVGVTDTGKRHPAVTAQAAATLNLLTKGRAILGIGPGERVGNEPYGVDWSRPVARFEEALATIRALWNSKGRLVKRDSPYFPLRDAMFDLPPYRGKWPEIWIAAHGPRMLRATGRYGDAWFPGFAHRPEDYAARLEIVRSAASDAGRDPMSITPAVWIPVITASSRDAVDEALDSMSVRAWSLNAPAEFYAHYGAEHPMGAGYAGMQDHVAFTMDEQTITEKAAQVPGDVVRNMILNGSPADVLEQAAVWRDHGVRHLVVVNFGPMGPSLRTGLATLLPFNTVVRRLKRL
ncbi:LLM class flavin-dependent oxidoreductase [Mycolicibacterium septicum DSM 44393]|uniref:LLM class flavin-dependent oxidoreductase n=1 Tax=Mycolicibacterium septicum DSM 44393 TaxID=1341646 RepID=A0A7X6RVG8_9MYCO|nr:LLM class flavin-dependent oxidoreductase [Mycolicibacterium septicum]NKZ11394.1 LLM class flavin-dependent oxidoreductase [Mycolicibacterium septicum DSM 44393]